MEHIKTKLAEPGLVAVSQTLSMDIFDTLLATINALEEIVGVMVCRASAPLPTHAVFELKVGLTFQVTGANVCKIWPLDMVGIVDTVPADVT